MKPVAAVMSFLLNCSGTIVVLEVGMEGLLACFMHRRHAFSIFEPNWFTDVTAMVLRAVAVGFGEVEISNDDKETTPVPKTSGPEQKSPDS